MAYGSSHLKASPGNCSKGKTPQEEHQRRKFLVSSLVMFVQNSFHSLPIDKTPQAQFSVTALKKNCQPVLFQMKPISKALLTLHFNSTPSSISLVPRPPPHYTHQPSTVIVTVSLCASAQTFLPSWNTLLSVLANYIHHLTLSGCLKLISLWRWSVFFLSRFKHFPNRGQIVLCNFAQVSISLTSSLTSDGC